MTEKKSGIETSKKAIRVGNIAIGGTAPVSVQSMTNTDTADIAATSAQIKQLADAGCDIIRVAIPNKHAAEALPEILDKSPIPVIGDIHFDHRLALTAIQHGINGIRINPGNIGTKDRVKQVAEAAGEAGIPIRVGANSGSLPEAAISKASQSNFMPEDIKAAALVEASAAQCAILEEFGFSDIKVSLKASDVPTMLKANREFYSMYAYPLHLGVTEAGTIQRGTIKSAVGIGILLNEGIGDTIRVSLTADPLEEVKAGIMILEALGLRKAKPEIVSCPTCGRTEINLIQLAERVEQEVEKLKAAGHEIKIAKIAVMGCIVNGPGEAKDAEIGIAGSKGGRASLFRNGESIGMFSEDEAVKRLIDELRK